jgi:hypothetical protein
MAETTMVTCETAAALPDKTRGVEHARTEQRAAAKFEGDDVQRLSSDPTGASVTFVQRGGAAFRCYFFVHIFEAHDLRSLLSVTAKRSTLASLEGAEKKKPTARFASGGGLETFC